MKKVLFLLFAWSQVALWNATAAAACPRTKKKGGPPSLSPPKGGSVGADGAFHTYTAEPLLEASEKERARTPVRAIKELSRVFCRGNQGAPGFVYISL